MRLSLAGRKNTNMIIHQPEVTEKENIVISTRVELQQSAPMPNNLWFSFPQQYKDYISYQSDGFIASLILRAMNLGEDVEVRGITSSRLAYGLEEYQAIFNAWLPRLFQRVEVTYQNLTSSTDQTSFKSVGTAFSGGVDSLHTLSSHLPQNQPNTNYQITHGLFIHGFDVSLANQEHYNKLWLQHKDLFNELGLTLLTAKTNINQFYAYQINWQYAHGGPLIGTALILGKLFQKFYISSSYDYSHIAALGTSPLSDHLLSTENTQIIHYGAATNRTDKINQLTQWQFSHTNLRVCIHPQNAIRHLNCGKCKKCISTMVQLYINGQLNQFTVFPNSNIFILFVRWFFHMGDEYNFVTHLIKRAFTIRKFWLIPLLLPIYIGGFFTDVIVEVKLLIPYRIKHWIRMQFGIG